MESRSRSSSRPKGRATASATRGEPTATNVDTVGETSPISAAAGVAKASNVSEVFMPTELKIPSEIADDPNDQKLTNTQREALSLAVTKISFVGRSKEYNLEAIVRVLDRVNEFIRTHGKLPAKLFKQVMEQDVIDLVLDRAASTPGGNCPLTSRTQLEWLRNYVATEGNLLDQNLKKIEKYSFEPSEGMLKWTGVVNAVTDVLSHVGRLYRASNLASRSTVTAGQKTIIATQDALPSMLATEVAGALKIGNAAATVPTDLTWDAYLTEVHAHLRAIYELHGGFNSVLIAAFVTGGYWKSHSDGTHKGKFTPKSTFGGSKSGGGGNPRGGNTGSGGGGGCGGGGITGSGGGGGGGGGGGSGKATTTDHGATADDSASSRCFNCGLKGHKAITCTYGENCGYMVRFGKCTKGDKCMRASTHKAALAKHKSTSS